MVKKGELLAQIDPRTYQAQLDQAEATLARDQAHLENGQLNLSRYVPLQKRGFAPQQQVCHPAGDGRPGTGDGQSRSGGHRICQGRAELYHLVAPFDGVTGIRLLDVGNIIQLAMDRRLPTGLVVVTQVQPISVIFTLAATTFREIQDAMAKGPVKAIAFSQDGKTELDTGTLARVNNQADTTSGTVQLKAIFPNQQSPVVARHVRQCPRW